MLLTLAWRNLWRNYRRSLIIIASVVLGVMAVVFSNAFQFGMMQQMLDSRVGLHTGHVQLHAQGYRQEPMLTLALDDAQTLVNKLTAQVHKTDSTVILTRRIECDGMLAAGANSSLVNIVGVDPAQEPKITRIAAQMQQGEYLQANDNSAVLGQALADKLEVEVGDRLVLTLAGVDGKVTFASFKLGGIYRSLNAAFDESTAFVHVDKLDEIVMLRGAATQIVGRSEQLDSLDVLAAQLGVMAGPQVEVSTYKELLPMLVFQIDMYQQLNWIVVAIFGAAMIFGIVNAMLMAVYERVHEFGVLMSIGMNRSRIFAVLVFEALLLGVGGMLLGTLGAYVLIRPLEQSGIDLTQFTAGLSSLGIAARIYPSMDFDSFAWTLVIVPLVSALGAVYPALRAMRLNPAIAAREF